MQIKDAYSLNFFENNMTRLPVWCNKDDSVKLPFCQIKGRYRMELPGYTTMQPYPHMNERCPSLPPNYNRPRNCWSVTHYYALHFDICWLLVCTLAVHITVVCRYAIVFFVVTTKQLPQIRKIMIAWMYSKSLPLMLQVLHCCRVHITFVI